MSTITIQSLADFNQLRTAPALTEDQHRALRAELVSAMEQFSWFTVGVMAAASTDALIALRALESSLGWEAMVMDEESAPAGPVFLKANQSSGLIRMRTEHGLGEGILISGQPNSPDQPGTTWGPLPLDFFA
ncbi:MAG: DUF1824 family protein [Synechococcus sp.]